MYSTVRTATCVVGPLVAALAICLLGFAKLADLPSFFVALTSWTMVPSSMRSFVGVAVPIVEVLLAGTYIITRHRTNAISLIVLVLGFTVAYIIQWRLWQQPSCGCFGGVSLYFRKLDEAPMVIAKNVLLVVMLAPSVFASPRPSSSP